MFTRKFCQFRGSGFIGCHTSVRQATAECAACVVVQKNIVDGAWKPARAIEVQGQIEQFLLYRSFCLKYGLALAEPIHAG